MTKFVLLVEDEPLVRLDIRYAIEKAFPDVQVIEAENGVVGMRVLLSQPVAAVVSDIRMPEMDGLTFLCSVRAQYPTKPIIVLSGHDDYEYVRGAFKLGALDYLLKPASDEQIQRSLSAALSESSAEAAVPDLSDARAQKLLLRAWLHKQLGFPAGLEGELRAACVPAPPYALACVLVTPEADRLPVDMLATSALLERLCHAVCVSPSPEVDCMLLALLPGEALPSPAEGLQAVVDQAQAQADIRLSIGVSPMVRSPEALKYAFDSARRALIRRFLMSDSSVFTAPAPASGEAVLPYEDVSTIQSLLIKRRGRKQLGAEVQAFLRQALQQRADPLSVRTVHADIVRQIVSLAGSRLSLPPEDLSGTIVQRLPDLTAWTVRVVSLCEQAGLVGEDADSPVRDAIAFVKVHFREAINLNTVAQRFGFTPKAFSRKFKQLVGMDFSLYLTRMRMDAARQMIRESDLTMQDISLLVGYTDPQYFYRVFKQHTGMTPSAYRANIRH